MRSEKTYQEENQEELLHELLSGLSEVDYLRLDTEQENWEALEAHLVALDVRWKTGWPLLRLYLKEQQKKKNAGHFDGRKEAAWKSLAQKMEPVKLVKAKFTYRRISWAAACLLLLLSAVLGWVYMNQYVSDRYTQARTYVRQWHTKDGASSVITLPDSTRVWLNAHSSLGYIASAEASVREVKLLGEAYFEVKSSVESPFHVHLPQGTIRVTGTRFFAGTGSSQTTAYVDLQEGQVHFSSYGFAPKMIGVEPQQRLSLDARHMTLVSNSSFQDTYTWLKKSKVVQAIPLAELVEQLEVWYGVSIRLAPDLQTIPFSGTIDPQQSLSVQFDKLRWTTDLLITGKDGKYTIHSK